MKDLTVGIFPHYQRTEAKNKAVKLKEVLELANIKVIMRKFEGEGSLDDNLWLEKSSIVVSIGGDGTFLRVARYMASLNSNAHLIGLNTSGSLGFLNCTSTIDQVKKEINNFIKGKFTSSEIQTLKTRLFTEEEKYEGEFINEAFLVRDIQSRLPIFQIKIGKSLLGSFHGEGVILSSSIGSTAQALSAGGSLISHQLYCINLVPFSAHSINIRPILVNPIEKPKVLIKGSKELKLYLFLDGLKIMMAKPPITMEVSPGSNRIKLLGMSGDNFYKTIRNKLSWGWKKGASGT
ncbi:MAG: NAD kinase [candidate division WS2 bacterium]|nr:NAD kinase [Candidatus Lithacetigena glycinireducens]